MDDNEKLAWSVRVAARKLGISTNLYYLLFAKGLLPGIRISQRRIIVPAKSIEDYLSSKGWTKDKKEFMGAMES